MPVSAAVSSDFDKPPSPLLTRRLVSLSTDATVSNDEESLLVVDVDSFWFSFLGMRKIQKELTMSSAGKMRYPRYSSLSPRPALVWSSWNLCASKRKNKSGEMDTGEYHSSYWTRINHYRKINIPEHKQTHARQDEQCQQHRQFYLVRHTVYQEKIPQVPTHHYHTTPHHSTPHRSTPHHTTPACAYWTHKSSTAADPSKAPTISEKMSALRRGISPPRENIEKAMKGPPELCNE